MSLPCDDERFLVQGCLAGDKLSWDRFFEIHYGTIRSVAGWRKWGFDTYEVDDVTQEILEETVKSLQRFDFRSQVSTFLYRIAVNTCISHLRKKKARKRICDHDCVPLNLSSRADHEYESGHVTPDPHKNQEDMLLESENIHALRKGLDSLGRQCRELIGYRYFEELSFQEIASKLNTKQNTLVIQLKRCLLRLLRHLQTDGRNETV